MLFLTSANKRINISISFAYILKYIDEEIATAVDYPAKPFINSFVLLIN